MSHSGISPQGSDGKDNNTTLWSKDDDIDSGMFGGSKVAVEVDAVAISKGNIASRRECSGPHRADHGAISRKLVSSMGELHAIYFDVVSHWK